MTSTTTTIERQQFAEGQILSARQLNGATTYSRGQLARHERGLHLWGIVLGLTLTGEDATDANSNKYKKITLTSGTAIDSSGRQIVVPKDQAVDVSLFSDRAGQLTAGQTANAWYPVFLIGTDDPAAGGANGQTGGKCGNGAAGTPYAEGFSVEFGRPTDALDWENQPAVASDAGPGDGNRRVLLGFVQWLGTPPLFKDVADVGDQKTITRRYAGVRAAMVATPGSKLTLRANDGGTPGGPAVEISGDKNGTLTFGPLDPKGKIKPVFTVTAGGDIEIAGKLKGALTTPGLRLESGRLSDGAPLPLPPSVTQEMVDAGDAVVHGFIWPAVEPNFSPDGTDKWVALTAQASVDAQRHARCRVIWAEPDVVAHNFKAMEETVGICNYLVLASVTEPKS